MPTTSILGYCVFDAVIDLADEAATAAIEAEMAVYLNGTGANGTVVSADISESTWFKGGRSSGVHLVCVICVLCVASGRDGSVLFACCFSRGRRPSMHVIGLLTS